jgi:hypothetical protein
LPGDERIRQNLLLFSVNDPINGFRKTKPTISSHNLRGQKLSSQLKKTWLPKTIYSLLTVSAAPRGTGQNIEQERTITHWNHAELTEPLLSGLSLFNEAGA